MQATPYKCFENWNYCHTHGGDVNNNHMSQTCSRPGPAHNWQASRQNTMAGSTSDMHKTILPSMWDAHFQPHTLRHNPLYTLQPGIPHHRPSTSPAPWRQQFAL